MSGDFYSSELQVRERIGSKYREAEAHRLANTARRNRPIHHGVRKSAGRALNRMTQAVDAVLRRGGQPSPAPR
jgi:hypothetical protein